ncbi:MAG: hypothetical protein M3021_01590, partial [Actinomycetota bacterium]|nr:hypothetical protein [Actinomycetota bacterium]
DQLDRAAETTGVIRFSSSLLATTFGVPHLAYHIWRLSKNGTLTDTAVSEGVEKARRRWARTSCRLDFAVPLLRRYLREHAASKYQPNLP